MIGKPSGPQPTSRRLLPITSTPFWDVDASVEEIRRCHAMGPQRHSLHRRPAIARPTPAGRPALEIRYGKWPASLTQPISFHIGSGNMDGGLRRDKVKTYGKMAAFAELSVDIFMRNGIQLSDLIISGGPGALSQH